MKYNFNLVIKNLDGESLIDNGKPVLASKLLANLFISQIKGDAIKFYDWANNLYKKHEVELDNSDADLFYKIIKEHEFATMIKAPILKSFKDQKEKGK